jgi:hypothetical protein
MSTSPFPLSGAFGSPLNFAPPPEGCRAIPLTIDFSTQGWTFDLQSVISRGVISALTCIFIDNSPNSNPLTITINNSAQTIIAPALSQGYYPVLCPNPAKFTATCTGGATNTKIHLLNYSAPPCVWGAASHVSVTIPNPLPVSITGTPIPTSRNINTVEIGEQLTLTGSAQQLYTILHAANAATPTTALSLLLQSDPSNGSGSIISAGSSILAGSHIGYNLSPGGFREYSYVDLTKIYVLGNTLLLNCEVLN